MKFQKPNFHKSEGFALVITLSLMILLTVVAVGLLSLSAVSLRTSSQAQAQAEAQANARLALIIAIGELQKQLGPDQRISANGAILDPDSSKVRHLHWTGAWDSWKAGPGEASQHSTIQGVADEMAPKYQAGRSDYFRAWLLSLNPGESTNIATARNLTLTGTRMPAANADAVQLVAEGSLGKGSKQEDYVSVRLLKVDSAVSGSSLRGRYGWWVGDESQKARITDDSYAVPGMSLTQAERIFRHQAPASTGTSTIKGLENLTNDTQLASLPSLATIDLVSGVTGRPAQTSFHHATPFSYGVLADVREGGLKRDLSTLLERPISISETQDQFMLYRFDSQGQERVPIQDIAAYYQMYDPGREKSIRYTSSPQNNLLNNGIQVAAPNFYANNSQSSFLREYTSLYRSPVPIKIQMVLAARAELNDATNQTYILRLGLAPAVTFWNPNNVPLVMNLGDPAFYSQQMRFMYAPFMITWNKNDTYIKPIDIAYAAMGGQQSTGKPGWASGGNHIKASIFDMYFSGGQYPIVFEPGETRVMSYAFKSGNFDFKKKQNDAYNPDQLAVYGWKSEFLQMPTSTWGDPKDTANMINNLLVIRPVDTLKFTITTEKDNNVDYVKDQETPGAALSFMLIQKIFQSQQTKLWNFRNYQLASRTGGGTSTRDFNDSLIRKGFGNIADELPVKKMTENPGQWFAFLQFAMMAGTEANEINAGAFAGRKFASRPFIHSTPMAPPRIDREDDASLYNHGWNWWVDSINSVDEAQVSVAPNKRSGYFGGGNSPLFGTTHVIQQEIPLVPPISIAALSHAHLGGFSLSNDAPNLNTPKVAAVGYNGLFPHTLQAIGNSYAHPHIPADKASTQWDRQFTSGGATTVTCADHSYLANKALWDEFFFSSITPQPAAAKVFGSDASQTAKSVAERFFFDDAPLPNRRIKPYKSGLDSSKLDSLFTSVEQQKFAGGSADQIAAHLMVQGSFNVNSTSVSAWKTVLASLKGKPVAYFDLEKSLTSGGSLDQATPEGTPVGPSTLPNGEPVRGSSSDLNDSKQWTSWRELSDKEMEELAIAMVKQVKLRGPFLSMSEFVNRRLDSRNEELSAKGALQAALDDDAVSINSGFRNSVRQFSAAEIDRVKPVFRKALEGPVAYGSAAYVDQADVLRNFAEQLAPRGDTFVIRTYGDALDASGKVVARAWCEAVVQRVPEYVDVSDASHLKAAELKSPANKSYGRKIEVVTFRWLGPVEV